jgi:hypothetical protein
MRGLILFSLATAVSAAVIRDTAELEPYNKDKLNTICLNPTCQTLSFGTQMYCLNYGVSQVGERPNAFWTPAGMSCPPTSSVVVPREAPALEPYNADKIASSCGSPSCETFGLPRQIWCLVFGTPPGGLHPTGYWKPFGMECPA